MSGSGILDLANIWGKRQEFQNTDHPGWRLNNLTTTQRDALTGSGAAKAGDIIYNTTTGAVEAYNGSGWDPVGGASGENGTVTTTATTAVEERGDDVYHYTKLTMTAFAVGTSGDNAALALGAKFYTFPAGAIMVESASIAGGITAAISVTTDTPEVGIGTVIGSGANATLSTTTENVVDGGAAGGTGDSDLVAPDVAGTAFYKANLSTVRLMIQPSAGLAHDLFLNVADTWADVAAAGAVTFTGVISLVWRKIS
jgi:hypothetical protein